MKTSNNIQGIHIQKSRGFTLLEALLGFLILAIGMLGIASLQALSLKAGKTSIYNSVAMMKVDEIFESMRANSTATALAEYQTASAGDGTDNGCTSAAGCTGTELAQEDILWWKTNLKAGMPDAATATVAVTAPVPPSKMAIATVTITWEERSKDSEVAAEKTYIATTNICTENPC
jgi:type IV pilus assembly protein PilV